MLTALGASIALGTFDRGDGEHWNAHDHRRRFLEFELRRVSAEKAAICVRHSVTSFDELWGKLEKGEVKESACWEDLTRLEFLELRSSTFSRSTPGLELLPGRQRPT